VSKCGGGCNYLLSEPNQIKLVEKTKKKGVEYVISLCILQNCQKWSLYFKNGQKNSINFPVIKKWFNPSDFSTECLFMDPTILILVPTFYKIGKNGPYILKKEKKSHNFLKYRDHPCLFCNM
jgi:hypothetical protein